MFKHKLENGAVLFSTILSACNVARFEVLTSLMMQFLLKFPFFFFLLGCRVVGKGQKKKVFVGCF